MTLPGNRLQQDNNDSVGGGIPLEQQSAQRNNACANLVARAKPLEFLKQYGSEAEEAV